ncbi:hypothetical protein MAHJHV47_45770 [Mycobacterium avium subsp. hominissuis]
MDGCAYVLVGEVAGGVTVTVLIDGPVPLGTVMLHAALVHAARAKSAKRFM